MGKNVSDVVVGMLSDAGSATRPPAQPDHRPVPTSPRQRTAVAPARPMPSPPAATGAVSPPAAPASAAPAPISEEVPGAPRTLRLRPEVATQLRAAWLEAKRDEVLLTAQDFASDLIEEALGARRRRRRAASTA